MGHLFSAETRHGQICIAATELFFRTGYHATSMRQIAEQVRVKIASLYNHIAGKQELLFDIMRTSMDAITHMVRAEVECQPANAEMRLRAAMRAHIRFHGAFPMEAVVTDLELRSLEEPFRRQIVEKRDEYEALWRNILIDGKETQRFRVSYPSITSTALIVMCNGIAQWYNPLGKLTLDQVADVYADLVLEGLLPVQVRSGPAGSDG